MGEHIDPLRIRYEKIKYMKTKKANGKEAQSLRRENLLEVIPV